MLPSLVPRGHFHRHDCNLYWNNAIINLIKKKYINVTVKLFASGTRANKLEELASVASE